MPADGFPTLFSTTNHEPSSTPSEADFPKKKENPHNSQGLPSKRVSKTLDPVSQKPQSMKITLSSSESIGKTSRSRIPHGSIERTRVFAEFWSVWMESLRDDGRVEAGIHPFASSSDVDDGRTDGYASRLGEGTRRRRRRRRRRIERSVSLKTRKRLKRARVEKDADAPGHQT